VARIKKNVKYVHYIYASTPPT